MNLIHKLIFSLILILGFFTITEVHAENYSASNFVSGDYIPDMYIKKLKANGSGQYKQGRIINKIDDNSFVYCLQPFADIDNSQTYQVTTSDYATILNMSKEQWNRVSLLAYYGYQYQNHTDSKWYYITQVLIWRTVDPSANIFFTNTLNGTRNDNLFSNEISEIENLIANHLVKPSFHGSNINTSLGESISLVDSNNVLQNYKVVSTDNVNARIVDNVLYIDSIGTGNSNVFLQKTDIKYDIPPIVYYSPYSQDVMSVGYFDPVSSNINIQVEGVRAKLIKIDSETKEPIAIAGAKFKIKNKLTNTYVCETVDSNSCEYETDSNGIIISPILSNSDYIIEEVLSPNGYVVANNNLEFSISHNSNIIQDNIYGSLVEVYFENKEAKGKIIIHKLGEEIVYENNSYYYKNVELDSVVYSLYAKEDIYKQNGELLYKADDLVNTYKTKKGYLQIDNLNLGKYYIKEESTSNNHILDDTKYDINLEYIDQNTPIISVYLNLQNYLKKGKLEFLKTNSDGRPLPNTLIEIYNEDSKLLVKEYTNEQGKITLENLPVGKFYILEKGAPEGYVVNEKPIWFEIKENEETIKVTMIDEKIKSTVKIHKVDENDRNLSGVIIGIYDLENNLVYKGITNDEGNIEIEAEYGSYYFQEISTIDGYELSDEKVYFDITEDGELIQRTLVNKMNEIEVPNTSANSYTIFIPILMFGIGVVLYVLPNRKKNKKVNID